MFAASLVIALIGILIMPSIKISYNDRFYIPSNLPSNVGYAAAERHFSAATMNPDILMIESDHDMRNTGDMISNFGRPGRLMASANAASACARGEPLLSTGATAPNPRTTGAATTHFRISRRDTARGGPHAQQRPTAPR